MKIAVIGTGYVGLVIGACFSELGNDVICVDVDTDKIAQLQQGIISIYEPGLQEMVNRNLSGKRLKFTNDINYAVEKSQVIFIAVGTPSEEGGNGSVDLSQVYKTAEDIGNAINGYKTIINKSTVPVGTADKVREIIQNIIIKNNKSIEFDVVSNPEFLKEGAAIEDFMKPDRIVIGSESKKAVDIMQELYKYFVRNGHPVFIMDTKSAEMTKYAANAILASRISFINEIANLCETVGADIDSVRKGIGGDSRIGYKFLYPGPGFGGSCFPKDIKALIHLAKSKNVPVKMLEAILDVNEYQKQVIVEKVIKRFSLDMSGMTFCVWGLSFKQKTNDIRESSAITIIKKLMSRGASISVFDPAAIEEAKKVFGNSGIHYASDQYEALDGADALIIVTEWSIFRNPDFDLIKSKLKNSVIFDGRNLYNHREMEQIGFEYYSIGRR